VDLFPRSLTAPSPKDKIADINPGIASNGLFWTVPMPDAGLSLSSDGLSATVRLRDFPVLDVPTFGANTVPTYAARIDLDLTWQGLGPLIGFTNPTHHYRVRFYRAMVQAMIRVRVPEIGFTFMSDAPDTTQTIFAMIGHDQNGLFF